MPVYPSILRQLIASSIKAESKVIPFTNDDVPKYLKRLDKFENRPSKRLIVIK